MVLPGRKFLFQGSAVVDFKPLPGMKFRKNPFRYREFVAGNLDFCMKRLYIMTSSFKREWLLLKKLHNMNISGDHAMKYHLLLPPVVLALCGCHSDSYYQEQAVESARKFIYKHARELSAEQFAYVRLTPPVLLTGSVLSRNAENAVKDSLAGGEKIQICVTWHVPDLATDYLVFGMSDPGMAYWRPLKLIRRKVGKIDSNAQSAMTKAREYAMNALYLQLSAADLNIVRFTHPELVQTSFALESGGEEGSSVPRPWKKSSVPAADGKNSFQLSLLWKISKDRYAVFCGTGKKDLNAWEIAMAGVFDGAEVRSAVVKKLKSSKLFLVSEKNASGTGEGQKNNVSVKTTAGGK